MAHFTDVLDGRSNSGTARVARELIAGLANHSNVVQTFIHFEKSKDQIYKLPNTREILIPMIQFPFSKHFFSFIVFWVRVRLSRNNLSFDLVHWHSSRVFPFFFLIPAKKVIVTLHDATIRIMKNLNTFWTRLFYWNLRFSMRKIDFIIGDSADACQKLIRFGKFPESKVKCVYLASNFGLIGAVRPIGFKLNIADEYFLCVSRWQPHKNVQTLIQGYFLARSNYLNFPKLILVGKPVAGYRLPEILVNTLNLADSVQIFQDLADEELAFLYDHAILNITPSLHEGFGLTVLEGILRNCPSMDHFKTSTSEISASAGMHIDMTSPDEISSALQHFYLDKNIRNALASQTRSRAGCFSWEKSTQNLLNLYFN